MQRIKKIGIKKCSEFKKTKDDFHGVPVFLKKENEY